MYPVTDVGEQVVDSQRLLSVFRALADPTRLAILELLKQRTHCNCEMGGELGLPANLVSHHLKVLREAGLVRATRHSTDARWIHYSLDTEALALAAAGIAAFLDVSRLQPQDLIPCPVGCDLPVRRVVVA